MHRKTAFLILFAAAAMLITLGTLTSKAQDSTVAPAVPAGWTTPVNISNEGGSSEAPTIVVDDNLRVYATWTEWYGGVGAPRGMLFNSTNAAGAWGTTQGNGLFYVSIDDVGFPTVVCEASSGKAHQFYHDGNFSAGRMNILHREFVSNAETDAEWMPAPDASSYVTAALNPVDHRIYASWMYDLTDSVIFELVWFYRDPTTGAWSSGDVLPFSLNSSKYWPHLIFDPKGTAHLLWITRSPAQVMYSKNPTPTNPNTWSAPINLSGDTARDWVAPRIAADKDGDVYVVWYGNTGGYESGTEEVWFKKTVNGVWQPNFNLTENTDRSEGPSIAVNPDTKDIYVAYHEYHTGQNWDVMMKTFDYAAQTWSAPVNFTPNAGHDGEPCLRVDKVGGLHMAYHYQVDGDYPEIYYTTKPGIIKPEPPTTISLAPSLSTDKTKKINTLTWTNNPANANISLTGNKIWRKFLGAADSTWAVLTTAAPTAIQYLDTNLDILTKYSYGITVVPEKGEESDPSAIVSESTGRQFELAPTGVTVTGGINKVLFYREKRNTISWTANPGNPAADVAGFEIHRKLATDPDSALALLTTVNASTTTYLDAKLSITKTYSYAVKTKFTDGKTSGYSTVVMGK